MQVSDGVADLARSFTITVDDLDDTDPTLSLNAPDELSKGKSVVLTGMTSDNVGVSGVEVFEDGTLLGNATLSTSPGGTNWRYNYVPREAGTFTLSVVARDKAGNTSEVTKAVSIRQAGNWPIKFGSPANDGISGMAVAADGSLFIGGSTEGSLGGEANAGRRDLYVAKYDEDGNRIWLEQFGTPAVERVGGLAMDTRSNVYLSGYTQGKLAGNAGAGSTDAFLAKYDSTGTGCKSSSSAGHPATTAGVSPRTPTITLMSPGTASARPSGVSTHSSPSTPPTVARFGSSSSVPPTSDGLSASPWT